MTAGLPITAIAGRNHRSLSPGQETQQEDLKDHLHKIQNFNQQHVNDVILNENLLNAFHFTLGRLRRLQKLVGQATSIFSASVINCRSRKTIRAWVALTKPGWDFLMSFSMQMASVKALWVRNRLKKSLTG